MNTAADLSSSVAKDPRGLVNRSSSGEFYATELESVDALHAKAWPALALDAEAKGLTPDEHLCTINSNVAAFYKEGTAESRTVWGRKKLIGALKKNLNKGGTLSMFLGGKSVGKSLVLRSAVQEMNQQEDVSVLYVNARNTGPSLGAGIVDAVVPQPGAVRKIADHPLLPAFLEALPHIAPIKIGNILSIILQAILRRTVKGTVKGEESASRVLQAFASAAQKEKKRPVLVVDEANLIFSPDVPASVLLQTRALLQTIVLLTKETQTMTVLFASSEHGYPYKLGGSGGSDLGFNLADLTGGVVHASEVSPKDMRELLTDKWGMGDRLADLFLAAYGGHIFTATRALETLSYRREQFRLSDVQQDGLASGINICVQAEVEHEGIIDMLRTLAVKGFVPLDSLQDPRAELLSLSGIAGVVGAGHVVPGLPKATRCWPDGGGFYQAGLIPTSQMSRLLILDTLKKGLLMKGSSPV